MTKATKRVACPLCEAMLEVNDSGVYCKKREIEERGTSFINVGDCDFHISFKSQAFKKQLSRADIKKLIKGKTITDTEGNKMSLDLSQDNGFYTYIEFAKKVK
ncbi:MAG: hypothetical protein LBG67_02180 [Campylobacteraceae bacterium]|nr:hypothetical protein [Campylobacteraceae bacterium]